MTPTQLRTALNDSRERLFSSISGLSEEQFRHVPAGESWNIAAHLAHLLRIERLYAARAVLALHEDEPHIESTRIHNDDDPALAQHLAVPQIIHGMQAARRELERTLDAGDAADGGESALERAVRHERIGRMTVRDIMIKMAQHEDEHTADVARLAKLAPTARVTIPLTQRA